MPEFENTGMRCVNFSLLKLLEQSGLRGKIDFFAFYSPNDGRTNFDSIEYRMITELTAVSDYDLVAVWGDFILTKKWLKRAAAKLGRASGWDEATVWKKIYATLFPAPGTSSRPAIVVFGQSLLGDSAEIFQDETYISGLRSLLRTALIASMRDPVSAARAANISGEPSTNHAGVDAALLLEPLGFGGDELPLSPLLPSRVGIFFGRTVGTNMTQLSLALALRRYARGFEPVWLPWLPEPSMPWAIAKIFGIKETLAPFSLDEFIQAVRSCRFVITDTYHLSLVSWSYGVPAICIGKGAKHLRLAIEKKKEIFFVSNFLEDFYIFTEPGFGSLTNGRGTLAIKRALYPGSGFAVRERLHRISASYIEILTAALKQSAEHATASAD